MNSCMKNEIVDIVGLCDPSTFDLDLFPYWTQISIPETLTIPEQKPDIEQINSVNISVEIIRKKIIVTPTSLVDNEEGKSLTGNKLIVEGNLCQAISYTADVPEQSIHTAHFVVPFSAYIVIPATTDLDKNYQVNPCVEDVFVLDVSKRQIFKNVTVLLQAVPAPISACGDEC